MAYILKNSDGSEIKHNGKSVLGCDYGGVVKAVNLEKRLLTIVGTDETVDRYGDIVRVKGWSLENYIKNPVFLWAHDYRHVPIGAAVKVVRKSNPKRMIFTNRFPSEGVWPFADMILQLFNEKILNASSVGFIPFSWEDLVTEMEIPGKGKEKEKKEIHGREFTFQELLELSAVPVPANPSAVQDMFDQVKSFSAAKFGTVGEKLFDNFTGKEVFEEGLEQVTEELNDVMQKGLKYEEETSAMIQVPFNFKSEAECSGMCDIEASEVMEEKPYANEHACRLEDPAKFDKFARKNCDQKHEGKCIDVIFGIKGGKTSIQALRYPKDSWTAAAARNHCAGRGGKFEAAAQSDALTSELLIFVGNLSKQISDLGKFLEGNKTEESKVVPPEEVKGDLPADPEKSLSEGAEVPPTDKEPDDATTLYDVLLDKDTDFGNPSPRQAVSTVPVKPKQKFSTKKIIKVANLIQQIGKTLDTAKR